MRVKGDKAVPPRHFWSYRVSRGPHMFGALMKLIAAADPFNEAHRIGAMRISITANDYTKYVID